VPGQVYYNASRRLILKGVDGIIFVGDSQRSRLEANIEAMHNLYENMESYGYDIESLPFVIQYNKRDLPEIMSVDELRAVLNPMGVPDFEAVAIEGEGVFQTLSAVSKLVVKSLS
jgi:mutual gliding-motility protein MglA